MALSGDVLGAAIADAVLDSKASPEAEEKVVAIWKKIANEIVNHVKNNAVVTVATGIPVSTTGTEAAQTGATTSTGTGKIT